MSLTPRDVRDAEFSISRKGYNEAEVDDFLDRVVQALEERDAALAEATAPGPATARGGDPEPSRDYADGEATGPATELLALAHRTAREHLAAAETSAGQVLAQAREEAAATVAAAHDEALRLCAAAEEEHRRVTESLEHDRHDLEQRLVELRRLVDDTREELEDYLTRVIDTVRSADTQRRVRPHALRAESA
jgi:cell division initiation protein